jgi:hypothetical protein
MTRTADYVIQGFQYQLHKTLFEILKSTAESVITVEGIVEDIEIVSTGKLKVIQCKYHETKTTFAPSSVFKPLLQMMCHFQKNISADIRYVLYAHFAGVNESEFVINKSILLDAMASKNADFKEMISALDGKVDVDLFLERFNAELGPSYETLVSSVLAALTAEGLDPVEVEVLSYPNAIHMIGALSIKHKVTERSTTRSEFMEKLAKIRRTAISRWTVSLLSRKKILNARRKQFKANLALNTRHRCFAIDKNSTSDFDNHIVLFIKGYLDKYHFKQSHRFTPLFVLNISRDEIVAIIGRLLDLKVIPRDGYFGNNFVSSTFLKIPMVQLINREVIREFNVLLLEADRFAEISKDIRIDDLIKIGNIDLPLKNANDINIDEVESATFAEINYMIGISNVYE